VFAKKTKKQVFRNPFLQSCLKLKLRFMSVVIAAIKRNKKRFNLFCAERDGLYVFRLLRNL